MPSGFKLPMTLTDTKRVHTTVRFLAVQVKRSSEAVRGIRERAPTESLNKAGTGHSLTKASAGKLAAVQ